MCIEAREAVMVCVLAAWPLSDIGWPPPELHRLDVGDLSLLPITHTGNRPWT